MLGAGTPSYSETGATGLEPATSGVTGRRSNQLNYAPERREIVPVRRIRGRRSRCCGQTWGVNIADWIAVAVIVLTAVSGFRRGLLTGALSLAGLVAGALVGARFAPEIVGDSSPYVPLVALGGAAIGGMLGQIAGAFIGRSARGLISILPPLRWLDSAGGSALGLCTGLAICWVIGATLLYLPGQTEARRLAQESRVVSALTEALPPATVMEAVERIDPFAAIVGPAAGVEAPDPSILRVAAVRAARPSVVRITGYACGLGVEGSGWIVRPGLVVTNAHVVAGVDRPAVDRRGGRELPSARGLLRRAQRRRDPPRPAPAGQVVAARGSGAWGAGRAARVPGERSVSCDAREDGPLGEARKPGRIRSVRARPDGRRAPRRCRARELGRSRGRTAPGRVIATIFGARQGSDDGYAVTNQKVENAVANVGPPLETACVAADLV